MKRLSILLLLLAAPFASAQEPTKPHKYTSAPLIHVTKGVVCSPFSADHLKFPRGLKPAREKFVGAEKFKASAKAPLQVLMIPGTLSMLGNDTYGDCVTASEAAAMEAYSVYCGLPETVVTDSSAIAWARSGGYLNGADLPTVMSDRQKRGIVAADGKAYLAGPYVAVDYTNEATLQAAIAVGPVNIGMDANALPSAAGNNQGWYAFGGSPGQFNNEDHCIRFFGYGPTTALFAALKVPVPSGAPANGYLIYTWSTIGVVDHAWVMSTVGETYLQNPTTVGQSPSPSPTPTPVPVPPTTTVYSASVDASGRIIFTPTVPAAPTAYDAVVNPDGSITLVPKTAKGAKPPLPPIVPLPKESSRIEERLDGHDKAIQGLANNQGLLVDKLAENSNAIQGLADGQGMIVEKLAGKFVQPPPPLTPDELAARNKSVYDTWTPPAWNGVRTTQAEYAASEAKVQAMKNYVPSQRLAPIWLRK